MFQNTALYLPIFIECPSLISSLFWASLNLAPFSLPPPLTWGTALTELALQPTTLLLPRLLHSAARRIFTQSKKALLLTSIHTVNVSPLLPSRQCLQVQPPLHPNRLSPSPSGSPSVHSQVFTKVPWLVWHPSLLVQLQATHCLGAQ